MTLVPNTLRVRPESNGYNVQQALPPKVVPIRHYLSILTQLGARTALQVDLPQVDLPPRPAGRPNPLDSESSDDGVILTARKEQVGDTQHTRHYLVAYQKSGGRVSST